MNQSLQLPLLALAFILPPKALASAADASPSPARAADNSPARAADNLRETAWAAYRAADSGASDAVSGLLQDLRDLAPSRSSDEPSARTYSRRLSDRKLTSLHVLDALARLDAQVPPEVLFAHVDDHPEVAIVLMLRGEKLDIEAIMALFDRWSASSRLNARSVAVGQTLASQKAPGIARRLLAMRVPELSVHVFDPDERSRLPTGIGSADGHFETPEGWPPYPSWSFVPQSFLEGSVGEKWAKRHSFTQLTDGPIPILWYRKQIEQTRVGTGSEWDISRAVAADAWLSVLTGNSEYEWPSPRLYEFRHPLAEVSLRVAWTGAEAYSDKVEAARSEILEKWWLMGRKLVDAGLLTLEEVRDMTPDIPFSVTDRRKKTDGPIPEHPMGVFLGHHPIHPISVQPRKPDGSLPVSGEPRP